jgi:hypothetical protein
MQYYAPSMSSNVVPLPNFQSRGKPTDDTIEVFIKHNITGHISSDKHSHGFLYIIGGSGYGKTWLGMSVASKIEKMYPNDLVLHVYIDFSNGCRWNATVDGGDPSISLGIRIAAKLLFNVSLSQLLTNRLVEANLSLFTLELGRLPFFCYSNHMFSYGTYFSLVEGC